MTVGLLDYGPVDIRMHYENPTEHVKRLGACFKEKETVDFIESFEPESVFFDIGANTGAYSLIAAALGHQVVAFEASRPNFARLLENIELNGFQDRIICVPDPVWKTREQIAFTYSSREPGAALHSINGKGPDREMMHAVPLDWWCFESEGFRLPQPNFIKVDVDGAEVEVIQGAVKVLRGVTQLLVEVDGASPNGERIEPLLNTVGLWVTSRHPHGLSPVSNVVFTRG